MADMVSSAVIQETVSQILSGVVQRYEEKNEDWNASRTVERLEMAQTRLQAAVDTSDKWLITDASLLRWRRKLRHAAQECGDALQRCRRRVLEHERHEREVRNLPVHKRVLARAAKSFVFSSFIRNDDDVSSAVRRFEWFADGAGEFLRFVELGGGVPRRHHPMPYDSLIVRHLFDGKKLQMKIVGAGDDDECPLYLLWVPFSSPTDAEHAVQASLSFIQKDSHAPDGNFFYGVILQVSESTDILGVAIRCLQVFPPHLRSVTEVIRRKISQLPTMDFSWVPLDNNSCQREHWSNLHSLCTRWFRPDPLCCKQHGQHKLHGVSNLDMDASLEPIIHVNLLCQIPCSKYMTSRKRTLLSEPKSSQFGSPYLQVGVVYMPHGSSSSSEDTLLLADKSSAVSELGEDDDKHHLLHTDITLEELNETVLLKASDYFRHNAEAAIHQMVWRSRHGCAYIEVRKKSMEKPQPTSARVTTTSSQQRPCRKTEVVQLRDQDLGMRAQMVLQFLNTWGAQAPTRIRNLIMKWVQKEMEIQLQHQQR